MKHYEATIVYTVTRTVKVDQEDDHGAENQAWEFARLLSGRSDGAYADQLKDVEHDTVGSVITSITRVEIKEAE